MSFLIPFTFNNVILQVITIDSKEWWRANKIFKALECEKQTDDVVRVHCSKCRCRYCDPLGHLCHVVRSQVSKALKKKKEFTSQKYIDCDMETFKKHIEEKFTEGITWDNYGEVWHIDHKIPLKYNNPTLEEVCTRLHYSNTQPMPANENMSKGNRYIS